MTQQKSHSLYLSEFGYMPIYMSLYTYIHNSTATQMQRLLPTLLSRDIENEPLQLTVKFMCPILKQGAND